jgi:hypothetical protein
MSDLTPIKKPVPGRATPDPVPSPSREPADDPEPRKSSEPGREDDDPPQTGAPRRPGGRDSDVPRQP